MESAKNKRLTLKGKSFSGILQKQNHDPEGQYRSILVNKKQ